MCSLNNIDLRSVIMCARITSWSKLLGCLARAFSLRLKKKIDHHLSFLFLIDSILLPISTLLIRY